MFSKFLKSILIFNRSQNQAPNFMLVYFLLSLVWHNQFFITLVGSNGDFSHRLNAVLSESSFQYGVVFFLTLLFFIVRLLVLYAIKQTDQYIEADELIEAKIGSDQVFTENKDVVRLLALLEETKAQLAKVKIREAKVQADKTETISKMLAVQAELDMAQADIAILSKSIEDFRAQQKLSA